MISVIASKDIYSIWGTYILTNLTDNAYKVKFTKGVNTSDIEEALEENSYGVVLMGKPIQENQVQAVESLLGETTELPFTKAYHYANWGEVLNVNESIVDEEVNFVSKMVEAIGEGDEFIKFKDSESSKLAKEIADGLQSHHKYDGGILGKNLMLLADFYGENLLENKYTSLEDIGQKEEKVLKSLTNNMKDYTNKKIEEANLQVLVSGTAVVSLFAEKHVNELGKLFIDSLTANGREVIVLIGQQTKGDDLYRIRTSEGVSANAVAQELNGGKGKERAATVFLPKGNSSVYNTIVRALNSANI